MLLLSLPTFAVTVPVLHHENVQDLGRYAVALPGSLALRRHYLKGTKCDIPRSPMKHLISSRQMPCSVMLGQKTPKKARGLVRPSVIPVRTLLRST